jgi:DNA-binding NarL/FixJ family response regulator
MKRVVVIEDQTAVREMLAEFIRQIPGYEIAGTFGDGQEGLTRSLALKPEIVVLDVGLPGLNGIEVLKQMTAHLPNVKVLVFSGRGSPGNIRELLAAGAQSYVDKMDGFAEFKKALEIIAAGGTFIGPRMASAMRMLIRNPEAARATHPSPTARSRFCSSLPKDTRRARSPAGSASASARWTITERTSCGS